MSTTDWVAMIWDAAWQVKFEVDVLARMMVNEIFYQGPVGGSGFGWEEGTLVGGFVLFSIAAILWFQSMDL